MVKLPHAEPGDQGTLCVLKDREKLKEEGDENFEQDSNTGN